MRTLCKSIVAGGIALILFTGGNFVSTSVNAVSAAVNADGQIEQDARQAAVRFFSAQKSGNVEEMIKYSTYVHDIANLKEFYTRIVKHHPLLQASITNAKVINPSLVILSTEIRFKDRIMISTTPVYKENNQWKIVRGIPPQGYTGTNSLHEATSLEKEAQAFVKNYIETLESGRIDEVLTHLYIVSPASKEQVKQHFQRLSKLPAKMELKQLTVIGNNLALVKFEQNFGPYTALEMIPMIKESNQWKLVFGQKLTSDSIPVGINIQEIK